MEYVIAMKLYDVELDKSCRDGQSLTLSPDARLLMESDVHVAPSGAKRRSQRAERYVSFSLENSPVISRPNTPGRSTQYLSVIN
ncbi:hypothetical protein AB1Y20_023647 [Prymnesium parvum]|uniref:Uncharacterized protein n=1 Tax=Prymnesium parvum TaxID=97485 RepID=A0AB34JHA7_PRYPA